jgi:hypothetical protein
VRGSLNRKCDIVVNTITPIPNPNKRDGHICPSYAVTKYLTDCINAYDIGMPISNVSHTLFFRKSYFN